MSRKTLFALWGGLYIVCAGLGFIPEPEGLFRGLLTALSLLFFLPPALLLHRAKQAGDRNLLALLRSLSALSLGLTLLLLVGNFLTVLASPWLGTVLHSVLTVVSAPMVASGYWALSLFLWASLLLASHSALKK